MENRENKPKILMIACDGLENGGIQAVIMSIVRNLHTQFEFDIIIFNEGEQYYSKEFGKYGNIYYLNRYNGSNILRNKFDYFIRGWYFYKKINDFLTSHGPYSAIHCHNYFESSIFLKAAAKAQIPIRVAHSHNVASPVRRKNPLYYIWINYYKKMIRKYATVKIGCSRKACEYLFDDDNDVMVINNAIDLKKFNPESYLVERKEEVNFIHVGRFCFQKNQLFVLDVFSEINKRIDKCKLTLIGSGSDQACIEEKIIKLGLADVVDILPANTDVVSEFLKADFMIFPSRYEGLGIVLIEAQAMGITCFVSEAIQPEADLGLCIFNSISQGAEYWANEIIRYINMNGKKKKCVDLSTYDISKIKEEYRDVYTNS